MTLKDQLLSSGTDFDTDLICRSIIQDASKVSELIDHMRKGKNPLAFRAAWILEKIYDKEASIVLERLPELITLFLESTNYSVLRHLSRLLAHEEWGEVDPGGLLDKSFQLLEDRITPVAVKVWCIEIIYRIYLMEPDIRIEFEPVLEELLETGSAGEKVRSRRILKLLRGN